MRFLLALLVASGCAALTGCHLAANGGRNLAFQAGLSTDETLTCLHDRIKADEAWLAFQKNACGQSFSEHYVRGFKAGFLDCFRSLGDEAIVPIPPPSYWKRYYQTPQGRPALDDWFCGFRHGATAAKENPCCPSAPRSWGCPAPRDGIGPVLTKLPESPPVHP